ncbi:MAG: transglycosylase SLT domain-containing protein [Patescibacteria group bacterium]|nr:transglycosylase SLT domain-containing protein [Patescibacteria group bacterium]
MQRKVLPWLYILGSLVWLFLPQIVAAAGLVPCDGTACQACNIAQLIQNIINFAIEIAIPLAMALFAYAGVLFATAGGGSSENVSRARNIFTTAVIGFVIALAAWLIINTLLYILLQGGSYANGNWFQIQCVQECPAGQVAGPNNQCRQVNGNLGTVFNQINSLTTVTAPASVSPGVSSTGGSYSYGSPTLSSQSIDTRAATVLDDYDQQLSGSNGICSQANLTDNQCTTFEAMVAVESAGNTTASSDKGAVGVAQVLPSTACAVPNDIPGCGPNGTVVNQTQVQQALQDPTINLAVGAGYYKEMINLYGDNANAIAAYNAGPGGGINSDGTKQAFAPSTDCPGEYAWQCSINPGGLQETQNYVNNVNVLQQQIGFSKASASTPQTSS